MTAIALLIGSIVVTPAPLAQAAVVGDNYPKALSGIAQDAKLDPWNFYNRECVSFVAWRLNDTNKVNFTNQYGGGTARWGNANNWGIAARAKGIRVDNLPAVGSVAWSTAGSAGHVAWVSDVLSNGKIVIEEYNYRATATAERGRYNTRTVLASSFTGFIHIKDLSVWPPSNGTFLRVDGAPEVYRLAGGAPIYVSSWAPFGGEQQTQVVSAKQFASLAAVPADGTLIRTMTAGDVFTMAKGAPIHVASWEGIGGEKPSIGVDDAAVANASGGGVWQHVLARPSDGFLRGAVTHRIFRVVSGRPYYVTSWAPYGGTQGSVNVDDVSLDGCDHLTCDPWGSLDSASGAAGSFTLAGWAMDPNNTDGVKIHVYVDGKMFGETQTGGARPDVDAVYHRGTHFGYSFTGSVGGGAHTVCSYAINTGAGQVNTQLGCRGITAG